jgi:hypothetical protein
MILKNSHLTDSSPVARGDLAANTDMTHEHFSSRVDGREPISFCCGGGFGKERTGEGDDGRGTFGEFAGEEGEQVGGYAVEDAVCYCKWVSEC